MRDDTDILLGIIEPDPDMLRQTVFQIAKCVRDRQKEVKWSRDLQFLTPLFIKQDELSPDLGESDPTNSDSVGSVKLQ